MKRIKTYLRSTASKIRVNHCVLLHFHCKKTDQLNLIETARELVGDNQQKLQTFGTLKIHLELRLSIQNKNR